MVRRPYCWQPRNGHNSTACRPLAYLTHSQTAAVDYVKGAGLLMAPAYAVPACWPELG